MPHFLVVLAAMLLGGCVLLGPGPARPPVLPQQWHAPLPAAAHGGSTATLKAWWSQFDDPLLARLIDAAQQNNGDMAQAAARIAQARANLRAAGGAAWPAFDGTARASRAYNQTGLPGASSSSSVGIDALWEIDLFGVTRNRVRAAESRSQAAAASWHELRVSLAAEVAATYVSYRACEGLIGIYEQDATSQRRTADLTITKVDVGLESRANGALASASAADASNRLLAQRAECDVLVKSLVALTTLSEPVLRVELRQRTAQLPQPASFAVRSVPAQWLTQRPDLAAIEREVFAAAAEVGASEGERYPRLSLSGSIELAALRPAAAAIAGPAWLFGPALSLPLFDAGRRAANVDAARARYDEARARYEQRVRTAAAEVEQALVRLDAATQREADARQAAQGFRQFLDAAQASWDVGIGSLLDLEAARRNALTAAAGLVNVQREGVAAWITLYKALGGGWSPDDLETRVSHNGTRR